MRLVVLAAWAWGLAMPGSSAAALPASRVRRSGFKGVGPAGWGVRAFWPFEANRVPIGWNPANTGSESGQETATMNTAQVTGTTEVQARHRFDEAAPGAWLTLHRPGFAGALRVEPFSGGRSTPTFLLRTPGSEVETCVLLRKPPGKLLASAHATEREHRVMRALQCADVPVPHTFLRREDASVIGAAFYVMEHVPGRTLWGPAPPGMTAAERAASFDRMNATIAALHRVDVSAAGAR